MKRENLNLIGTPAMLIDLRLTRIYNSIYLEELRKVLVNIEGSQGTRQEIPSNHLPKKTHKREVANQQGEI